MSERPKLSHLDAEGRLRMVDISEKRATLRTAVAGATLVMARETVAAIASGQVPKGDVLTCARVAGIQAAKRTAELVPLCHPLALTWIDVQFEAREDRVAIEATVSARDATGVEMEALTAVTVAALTVYDMCKAIDKEMIIEGVRLLRKSGGRSEGGVSAAPARR